jgi:hypothetical protein
MSTARILIKQGAILYRFMRFETSSDGSIVVLVDRDPRSKRGGHSWQIDISSGQSSRPIAAEPEDDRPLPSFRFTVHTTGVIHRYAEGVRRGTILIEPLHHLTQLWPFAFVSIPSPSGLDQFDETKHRHDISATLEIPENVSERISFHVEIGPKPQEPQSFGAALNYELYSVVVRTVPSLNFPAEITSEHFVAGMVDTGPKAGIDKETAELSFYQRIHGPGAFIFREDKGGAYIAMAAVRMARPPDLKIAFGRPDLRIEVIRFEKGKEPTHKVRFWICDKGGRNKTEDLRQFITSVELNAQL